MDFATALFLGTFFITSLMLVLSAAGIASHLREIRDDLRKHFEAEGRRWASDYEWRNSE